MSRIARPLIAYNIQFQVYYLYRANFKKCTLHIISVIVCKQTMCEYDRSNAHTKNKQTTERTKNEAHREKEIDCHSFRSTIVDSFTVTFWRVCNDSRRVIVRLMSIYAGYYRRLFYLFARNNIEIEIFTETSLSDAVTLSRLVLLGDYHA